ncbi:MAG: hypothetical protein CMI36_13320 [Owenweeksia sp.]|nr:hypothetical protein [Owenweeksia sp.]MBF99968.1 hypothetical protein [Owenweeksia sp.]
MLENIYSLFNPTHTDFEIWYSSGFVLGFTTLVLCCLLMTIIYYLIIGRTTRKYASVGWWFSFMFFTELLVFISTALMCGFLSFDHATLSGINMDIWVFAIWNSTLYTVILFLIFSLIFNNLSLHNRHVPFNPFR